MGVLGSCVRGLCRVSAGTAHAPRYPSPWLRGSPAIALSSIFLPCADPAAVNARQSIQCPNPAVLLS